MVFDPNYAIYNISADLSYLGHLACFLFILFSSRILLQMTQILGIGECGSNRFPSFMPPPPSGALMSASHKFWVPLSLEDIEKGEGVIKVIRDLKGIFL